MPFVIRIYRLYCFIKQENKGFLLTLDFYKEYFSLVIRKVKRLDFSWFVAEFPIFHVEFFALTINFVEKRQAVRIPITRVDSEESNHSNQTNMMFELMLYALNCHRSYNFSIYCNLCTALQCA